METGKPGQSTRLRLERVPCENDGQRVPIYSPNVNPSVEVL